MPYQLQDCVLIATGLGWPEDNTRQRQEPEDIGKNSVGYMNTRRSSAQSGVRHRKAPAILGQE